MVHGIYVHIPFCERRCHYCDFNTYEGQAHLAPDYAKAVALDLERGFGEGLRPAEGGLKSVYFGGGTPSLLDSGLLKGLRDRAAELFPLAPGAEVTLEANPGTVDEAKLAALRAAGFNRVSFGFQAAQDSHLQALGRIHDAKACVEAWNAARRAGFDNLSLDLMFGLSRQTLGEWKESLAWGLALGPEHVSFYGLTVEPGTRFHRYASQGALPLPGEDLQVEMYEAGVEAMAKAGLAQYEISNFARPGREAVHNSLYWLNRDTLGVGAGAWSFLGGRRSGRILQPKAYMDALGLKRDPTAQSERLEGRAARAEAATLRLRLNSGLDLGAWREGTGRDFFEEFGPALGPAIKAGCLERPEGGLRLTAKGRLLSNEVFAALL